MRILVVDFDETILQSIELMLRSERFNVYGIDTGEEAIELGKLYDYDLIVLSDTADIDQIEVLRTLRNAKVKTPILVVTGLRGCERIDRVVTALDVGADDYMTKPFHKDELVARINAIVRRSKGHAASVITVGNVSVNIDTKTVTANGQPINLTGKEFQMMELLALRKGVTLSKEMFLNHLYGGRDEPELKIIDVFICKLRKKLTRAGAGDAIETVWGRGYLLADSDAAKVELPPAVSNPVGRDLMAGEAA